MYQSYYTNWRKKKKCIGVLIQFTVYHILCIGFFVWINSVLCIAFVYTCSGYIGLIKMRIVSKRGSKQVINLFSQKKRRKKASNKFHLIIM